MVTGSHETNIMAVLNKQVDLATNNTNDMEKVSRQLGDRAKDIRVVWTSPLIPADPLVWRKDLAADVKAKVASFFLGYAKTGSEADQERERKNLEVLTFSAFKPSTDDQLLPIRQLELFKTRAKVEADAGLSSGEKTKTLTDIDAKLAELQQKTAKVN